ncbi:hypothetical protein ABZ260_24735 [Streptosporangium sp. NPDC006013]|uniref:hypothetical protein n=1 Tax=Streptosporangium sp. NPDC006013 TaxID=3155596 RepID=UPI0033A50FE0
MKRAIADPRSPWSKRATRSWSASAPPPRSSPGARQNVYAIGGSEDAASLKVIVYLMSGLPAGLGGVRKVE